MRLAAALLALASAVTAQVSFKTGAPATAPAATAKVVAGKVQIGPQAFRELENRFDYKISTVDPANPFDLLGGARGLYLDGYGVVFTAEVSLVRNPPVTPFAAPLTVAQITELRQKKLNHLPVLQKAMTEMMATFAAALNPLPADQRIVFAVRLLYQPWEQTADLPAQVVMTADRSSAGMGKVQVELQK